MSIDDVIRENWAHARHVENQRLTFTEIYAAIVAGVLALSFKDGALQCEGRWQIMLLLFVFSAFGYFMVLKWNAEFGNHIARIKAWRDGILPSEFRKYVGLPITGYDKEQAHCTVHIVSVSRTFVVFYGLLTALWFAALVWSWGVCFMWCLWLPALALESVMAGAILFILAMLFAYMYSEDAHRVIENSLDP